jgi:capsular polysaccharide biosynthesis protein
VNNAELEALARRRGYRIVHAERLTLPQKIAVFATAEQIVGEFGSTMHNSVFSNAGTRVAVLQSPEFSSFVQAGIGHVRAQPTGFTFGQATGQPRHMHLSQALFAETLDRLEQG